VARWEELFRGDPVDDTAVRSALWALLFLLPVMAQTDGLRRFLESDEDDPYPIFYDDARYRAELLRFRKDPALGPKARWLMVMIGNPEDVRTLVDPAGDPEEMYMVLTAMLAPGTEAERTFLRRGGIFGTVGPCGAESRLCGFWRSRGCCGVRV
jgi:hypothetical protein